MFRRVLRLSTLLSLAVPAHAQPQASLGVFAGYYRPFGHFDPASVYSTSLPTTPADLKGLALGAVGQLAITNRFGIRAQWAVARSTLPEVITPGGPRPPLDAEVDIGTIEGLYKAGAKPGWYELWLGLGPAVLRHAGDVYARYGDPRSVGATGSLELVVPLGLGFHVAADATALWYVFDVPMPPELSLNPGSLEHGAQRDALLHVSLRWGHPLRRTP